MISSMRQVATAYIRGACAEPREVGEMSLKVGAFRRSTDGGDAGRMTTAGREQWRSLARDRVTARYERQTTLVGRL